METNDKFFSKIILSLHLDKVYAKKSIQFFFNLVNVNSG